MDVKDSVDHAPSRFGEPDEHCSSVTGIREPRHVTVLLELLDLPRNRGRVNTDEGGDIRDPHGLVTSVMQFEQDDDRRSIDAKPSLTQQSLVHSSSRERLGYRLQPGLELIDSAGLQRLIRGLSTYFHQATIIAVVHEFVTDTRRADVNSAFNAPQQGSKLLRSCSWAAPSRTNREIRRFGALAARERNGSNHGASDSEALTTDFPIVFTIDYAAGTRIRPLVVSRRRALRGRRS